LKYIQLQNSPEG